MPLVDWGLVAIGDEECRRLLATETLGRVGLSVNALPVILPVNYRMVDGKVAFWSAPGLKLDAARDGLVVAFEVEGAYPADGARWSVLVVGMAGEVTDPDVVRRARATGLAPTPRGDRPHLIQIDPRFISGRRIGPPW